MRSNLLLILISIISIGFISALAIRDENSNLRSIQIAHHVNHRLEFELDDLKSILESDNVKDRQVVIVSIVGAFRKGKSFLLNFFLRYLHARYQKHDVSDWISESNSTELRGFAWQGGRKPVTTGIVIWPDIFTHDYENGDKVAIILFDTQGTFDSRSTLLESTTVFALSTLLSSVECYNVMQNIQEDDLQHLQLFVEYARLALEQSDEKPFQNLLFIVRDWQNQFEVDYGWNGQQLLDEVLTEHSYQTEDMRELRRQIRSSFANITAFLMPHPGRIVANGQFTGRMEEIDSDFKKYLQVLVPSVFAPENLVVKKINGLKVRARELVQYIEQYTKLFNAETLPEPKTVLQATAEVNNMILYNHSLYEYSNSMGKYFADDAEGTYYNPTVMNKIHRNAKANAIEQFQSKRKLGNKESISTFERRLNDGIDLKFQVFQATNEKIRSVLIEKAKFSNEKYVNEINLAYREKMIREANGISDVNLSYLFTETKRAALERFDVLKMGDDLGDNRFSDSFRKKLVQNLDTFLSTLNLINKRERDRQIEKQIERQREIARKQETERQNSISKLKTGGGALAGAGVGAMIGGPPGAAIGFFFGALFGYNI